MNEHDRPENADTNPDPSTSADAGSRPVEAATSGAGSSGAVTPAGAPAPAPAVMSQQEIAVRSALETVMDPEIGLSVIDLGLIRTVSVGSDRTYIEMLLTTPFCPYAPQMVADVTEAAKSVVDQETKVEVLPDAWNPQMMPDPGLLGFSY